MEKDKLLRTTALIGGVLAGTSFLPDHVDAAQFGGLLGMQCPIPNVPLASKFPGGGGGGQTYTPDAAGIITNVVTQDVDSMFKDGCVPLGVGNNTMVGRLLGVNMNVSSSDQAITMFVQPSQYVRYTKITFKNCSVSMATAAGGIYTAASQSGTTIVSSAQVYSTLTAASQNLDLTIVTAVGLDTFGGTAAPASLFVNLTTRNSSGGTGTCDAFVYGDVGQ